MFQKKTKGTTEFVSETRVEEELGKDVVQQLHEGKDVQVGDAIYSPAKRINENCCC